MVRLSNRNIHSNALAISNYLGISSIDRVITTLPMNYSYGLSVLNSHFVCGATIFLSQNSITDRKFWDLFHKNSITTLNGVPQFYEMLVKMRFSKMELPSLRTMTQAGGKLSDSITRELLNYCVGKNILFYSMYGQTEASPRMSFVPPSIATNKVGSIGIPIPGGKLSLWDQSNTEITSDNTVGELCYTGENVFMGYAEERSDLSKGHTNEGFLRTGDLAFRDRDGFFTVVGRLSRFAKVFGLRINLDDLERNLKTLQSECACIGKQDQIVIFTTVHDTLDDLRDAASIFTGLNRHAFVSRFVKSIPTTESGKTKYAELE
jgi:acyl-CoA synthetase (AMP-forming)/AMP-acid ligase II